MTRQEEDTVAQARNIREGMQVYGGNDQLLGTVERVQGDGFDVAGYHYSRELVARVAQNRVYVRGTGMVAETAQTTTDQTDRKLHVPVAEERLTIGKRAVKLGGVDIRKTVVEEEQTVPVTLRREELRVEEIDIEGRLLRPDDDAFNAGEITIELRGEEAVVAKDAVVTGEVVIEKAAVSEERQVTDTVRRQHVDVGVDRSTSSGTTATQKTTVREQGRTTRKG